MTSIALGDDQSSSSYTCRDLIKLLSIHTFKYPNIIAILLPIEEQRDNWKIISEDLLRQPYRSILHEI
jgi:hypothetical protein